MYSDLRTFLPSGQLGGPPIQWFPLHTGCQDSIEKLHRARTLPPRITSRQEFGGGTNPIHAITVNIQLTFAVEFVLLSGSRVERFGALQNQVHVHILFFYGAKILKFLQGSLQFCRAYRLSGPAWS